MIEWARIEAALSVLDRIRPVLLADGIDVELIDMQDHITRVRLTGACARCTGGSLMLQSGLEEAFRREIHDFGELQLVCESGGR
jgi:Fe-S cluster biogenesis protein NfuA